MGLSNTQKGIFLALTGYSFFTLSDTCMKLLGEAGYSVTALSLWSYFVCLIMSLVFAMPKGMKKSLGSKKLLLHIMRSFCMLFVSLCSIAALSGNVSLPTMYTVIFLCPSVTAIAASVVYKEKISKLGWSVLILGFAGIVVAFVKDASFSNPAIIYTLGVLFFGALINLMARPIDGRESMLTFPFYHSVVIVLCLLVYILAFERQGLPIPSMTDLPVAILGGVFVFFAQMFVLQGYRVAPHAYVAPTQYTQMISGILVGYYVFNHVPGPWVLVGAGMIIASGLLLITQKK